MVGTVRESMWAHVHQMRNKADISTDVDLALDSRASPAASHALALGAAQLSFPPVYR